MILSPAIDQRASIGVDFMSVSLRVCELQGGLWRDWCSTPHVHGVYPTELVNDKSSQGAVFDGAHTCTLIVRIFCTWFHVRSLLGSKDIQENVGIVHVCRAWSPPWSGTTDAQRPINLMMPTPARDVFGLIGSCFMCVSLLVCEIFIGL